MQQVTQEVLIRKMSHLFNQQPLQPHQFLELTQQLSNHIKAAAQKKASDTCSLERFWPQNRSPSLAGRCWLVEYIFPEKNRGQRVKPHWDAEPCLFRMSNSKSFSSFGSRFWCHMTLTIQIVESSASFHQRPRSYLHHHMNTWKNRSDFYFWSSILNKTGFSIQN